MENDQKHANLIFKIWPISWSS